MYIRIFIFILVFNTQAWSYDTKIIEDNCECSDNISVDEVLAIQDRSTYQAGSNQKYESCSINVTFKIDQIQRPCLECLEIGTDEVVYKEITALNQPESYCSKADRKQFLEALTVRERSLDDILELNVEQDICGAVLCNRSDEPQKISLSDKSKHNFKYCKDVNEKGKIRKCRKKLVQLFVDHKESVHRNCQETYGSNPLTFADNRCVKRNVYRNILFRGGLSDVEYKFCNDILKLDIKKTEELEKCFNEIETNIYDKLLSLNLITAEDIKVCEHEDFYTLMSKQTCKAVIIGNLFGFNTQDDKFDLFQCIYQKSSHDQISNCYNDFMKMEEDNEALDYIKQRFCANYSDPEDINKCAQSILAQYMDEFSPPQECLEMTNEAERQECIRNAFFEFLKNKDHLGISDCWNKDKYPTLKEQGQCVKDNEDTLAKIRKCLPTDDLPISDAALQCLLRIKPQEDVEKYLKKLAAYSDQGSFATCNKLPDQGQRKNCIMNLLAQRDLASSNPAFCTYNPQHPVCQQDGGSFSTDGINPQLAGASETKDLLGMSDTKNDFLNNAGTSTSPLGGDGSTNGINGSSNSSALGSDLNLSDGENSTNPSGDLSLDNNVDVEQVDSEVSDLAVYGHALKDSPNPICKKASKAALDTVNLFTLNMIATRVTMATSSFNLNDEEANYASALDAQRNMIEPAKNGSMIDSHVFNKGKGELHSSQIELIQARSQSPTGTIDCNTPTTTVFILRKKKAYSFEDIFYNFKDQLNTEYISYSEIDLFFNKLDVKGPLKNYSLIKKISHNIFNNVLLPNAYAENDNKKLSPQQIQGITTSILGVISQLSIAKGKAKKNEAYLKANPIEATEVAAQSASVASTKSKTSSDSYAKQQEVINEVKTDYEESL
jgi:hypothetical protein